MRITSIIILLLIVFFQFAIAQKNGWKANPEVVEQWEEERPYYLWHESLVPAFTLPHPLKTSDSSFVRTPEEWPQRRDEILNLFRTHMYGHRPGPPENLSFNILEKDPEAMNGAATLSIVEIKSRQKERTHTFELILFLPNEVQEPIPVFLLMNNRDEDNTDPTRQEKSGFWPAEEVIDRNYGIAAIQNGDIAPDDANHYHEGAIQLFEGKAAAENREPDAWAAISAWSWGASRVMDYFETNSRVDTSKVAVLGHSRGGKASLWAGAEDERFSLVISNDSGSGGAALSRRKFGETIRAVNRITHWFTDNLDAFDGREEKMPFDQHMLISLIAPRAVYVASADEDLWADPRGEFLSLMYASPVYALWGYEPISASEMPKLNQPFISGPRGYHIRSGEHNLTPKDWHFFMDYADQLWR